MIFGIDYLLGSQYPKVCLESHPKGWAAGFFAGNYRRRDGGLDPYISAAPLVEQFCKLGKAPIIRVHLLWDDGHGFGLSDLPLIRREAKLYEAIAVKYPSVRIEVSPCCEHNLNDPDKYLDVVAQTAPHCHPVNTPWQGALSKKHKNEVHGTHSAPKGKYNYSFDGTSALDADVERFKKHHAGCEVFYLWMPQLNRKKNSTDATPRPKRKVVPTVEQIESLSFLSTDKGKAELPAGWLWKSHADQHGEPGPQPRESKPVLVCPVGGAKIELVSSVASGGKVLGKLVASGKFTDGRSLYRLSEYGYKVMLKAWKIQKPKVLRLRVNGKIVGKVNAGFRQNEYRV